MRKLIAIALFLACASIAQAQSTSVSGTITDSGGQAWIYGSYRIEFYPGPAVGPFFWNGSQFNPNTSFAGALDGSGAFSGVNVPSNAKISPAGTGWRFTVCPAANSNCYSVILTVNGTTQNVTSSIIPPPTSVNANSYNQPVAYSDASIVQPQPGFMYYNIAMQVNRQCQGPLPCTWVSIAGGGGGTPGSPPPCVQLNIASAFATIPNFCLDSGTSPTLLTIPLNLNVGGDVQFLGPNPYYDIRQYGARDASIVTSGSGSGTSLSVGVSSFLNRDPITIRQAGNAPAISTPTGLAVVPSLAAGLTTVDVPTVAGSLGGGTTYQYAIFAHDILGGTTVPTATVTTTTGPTTLGENRVAISTWSLTGNTLTITTTVPNGFPVGAEVHHTGTSNNALGGGWYPISSITNSSTYVVNNVPQYSATTINGTGGLATVFTGNALTWTASTGGTPGTTNMPFDYFVCAKRPGDGSFHIIGKSFPSTFYGSGSGGYISTRFTDFGPTLASNPVVPFGISDSNCTAVSATNESFTTTVLSGGGTTGLTLAASMPNAVTGQNVLLDNAIAIKAAATAAAASNGTLYIPASSSPFKTFTVLVLPANLGILQAGTLDLFETAIVSASTNWVGQPGGNGAPQFGFNAAPQIFCGASPCIWMAGISSPTTGGDTFTNLTPEGEQNGLLFLADTGWGAIWDKVNFVTGETPNLDNMGIGLMIRPGAGGSTENYKVRNSNFLAGPNQVIDQSWAPVLYADQGPPGGSAGSVGTIDIDNTSFALRGIYDLGTNINPGSFVVNIHGLYRQAGITPMLQVQNINGNMTGQLQMDVIEHDTESQAAYAWICNLSCSGGFGVPFRLGFANSPGQDTGTIPSNVTGGGNQPIQNIVASFGPGANSPTPQFTYQQGRIDSNVGMALLNGSDFANFATLNVCLENSGFCGNALAGTLAANRTYTFPDASGTVCLTSTCGGQFYQTIQANGVAQTQEPTANYVAGANMTITPTTVGGVTVLTFTSSSTASTAWASITAGTNANAGTFTATGNTWNFGGAAGFTLPSGTTIPGSGSGAVSLVAQAAAGTPTVTFGTSSGTPVVTASSPLGITTATGNITCATCVTSSGGGALSATAPITVSSAGLIAITAATTGALGSIELTGNLGGTGASPTVIATTITGFTVNRIVKFDSGGNLINTAASEASSVFTIPEILDNTTFPYATEVPNASSTGTTVHMWASLTGAPSAAIITTANTTGAIGIVAGGAGTTGSAQIAVLGEVTCVFSGGTTANDFVTVDASVNGECSDAGSSPVSGMPTVIVLSTNVGAGTYHVKILGGSGGSGGGSGTVNACASYATSPIAYYTASTGASCDADITVSTGTLNLGIAGSAAGSITMSGSSSGTITLQTQAAAGTYNWNYPITAGTATYLLTSQGGSTSAMTWTVPTITINGQSCTLAGSCTTLTLDTNTVANGSQVLLNFVTSTSNTIGLTNTPVNSSTSQEQFQITGVVNASGGGTGVSNPTAHSLLVAEGASNMALITSPSTNGNYICGFNVTASAAVDVSCNLTGVPVLTPATPYTGAFSDRATVQRLTGGTTFSWTAPQITGNTAANFPVVFLNNNSGDLTFTANAADKVAGGSLGGTYVTHANWATFMYQDNSIAPGNWWTLTIPQFGLFPDCQDTGGNHFNFTLSTGAITCGTSSSTTGGTVTSVATSSPITGGTFTTSGTIACATCVTSAASLTSTAIVIGGGLQATSTDASATLSAGALSLAGGGSVTLGGSSSGTFAISVTSTAATMNLGSNATLTAAGALTVVSCTGCAGAASLSLSSIIAATTSNTIANGNNGAQVWNWAQTTNSQTAFTFGETTAASGTGDIELAVKTIAGSTAIPLVVTQSLGSGQTLPALKIIPTWNTGVGVVDAALLINVTNTGSGTGSLLIDAQIGGTSQFEVDKGGNVTALGLLTGSSLSVSGAAAMGQFNLAETTAPSGASSTDICYGDSTAHSMECSWNNGVFAPIPQYRAFAALTDGATVTWAIASVANDNKTLTFTAHGGSRTLNITNPVNGGNYVLWLKQDATGGEGLTLGSGCTWKVSGGGSGAISPSTGASAIDVLAFTYDGTNCYANFNKNFN